MWRFDRERQGFTAILVNCYPATPPTAAFVWSSGGGVVVLGGGGAGGRAGEWCDRGDERPRCCFHIALPAA